MRTGIEELRDPSIHLTGDFCKVARQRAAGVLLGEHEDVKGRLPVDVAKAALYIYTAHHVDLMER